ncbi:ANK-REP-REGION domain-containing protein [Mycena sanguinolenta]|uniref:ANK-REP-REGION domain-containing protein n=1 Tax=Mycena sanguinolenta TaxID=230812 RepID=A0A8H6YN23_9AGAR|nr:ANK-REP-REGION domain-containing protein [Mycena sanguinolenta]
MAELAALPAELILQIISFSERKRILDMDRLPGNSSGRLNPELVPDLPSINALAQTNITLHRTLDQTLYKLCASVETLGKLALLFAVEHQLENTVDKLVAAGVSLDAEYKLFRGSRDVCGLLHIAARMGIANMVVKLLGLSGDSEEMKTKVYERTSIYGTALDCAVLGGHLEVVKILAHISLPCTGVRDSPGSMHEQYLSASLVESVKAGNTEIAKFLLSQGSDVNSIDDVYSATPLYHATAAGNLAMVQLLLASGADPNATGRYGVPPLFRARAIDIAQALVDAGANVNALDDDSSNVFAYIKKDSDMFQFLLEHGADPNRSP